MTIIDLRNNLKVAEISDKQINFILEHVNKQKNIGQFISSTDLYFDTCTDNLRWTCKRAQKSVYSICLGREVISRHFSCITMTGTNFNSM